MKKVILLAVAFLLVFATAHVVATTSVELIDESGYAVSSELSRRLKSDSVADSDAVVDAARFSSGDRLVRTEAGIFISSSRSVAAEGYPLYIDDGKQILTLDDSFVLITDVLDYLPSFSGMRLSDGHTYLPDGTQADTDEFVLLLLPNGLYLNAARAVISTTVGDVVIPRNSIINFDSDFAGWYAFSDEQYNYASAAALDDNTTITIGDTVYGYHELLTYLGILQQKIEQELPDTLLPDETVIISRKGQSYSQSTGASGSQSETAQQSEVVAGDAEPSEGGVSGTQGATGAYTAPGYEKPTVVLENIGSNVYGLSASLSIEDKASRIYKGARLEVYVGSTLYLRKTLSVTGDVSLSPLRPDTAYTVVGSFEYYDESGLKVKEEFYRNTVATLPISSLAAIEIELQQGTLYSNVVCLSNIHVCNGSDADVDYTASNINRAVLQIGSTQYPMLSFELEKLKESCTKTITAQLNTSATLNSDSSYNYKFLLLDRYGNKLPLVQQVEGSASTCKIPPEASVSVKTNKVAQVKLHVDISNPDQAAMQNTALVLRDMQGNLLQTQATGESAPAFYHEISGTSQDFTFTDLAELTTFQAEIVSDYDIGDGDQYNSVVIGLGKFTTLPISSLGYVFLTSSVSDITQTGARLQLKLDDAKTDATLLFLLNEIKLTVQKAGSETYSLTLTSDAVSAMRDGTSYAGEGYAVSAGVLTLQMDSLTSATEYTLTAQAWVKQGGRKTRMATLLSTGSFKTLRAMPTVTVENIFTTLHEIELMGVSVADPDGAITGGVTVQLRDENGALIDTRTLTPNEQPSRIKFTALTAEATYTVAFYAKSLNCGHTNATAQPNYKLGNDFTAITRQTITGSIRMDSLLPYDSVSGAVIGENLIDYDKCTLNKYINPNTGGITNSTAYEMTDYIAVTPGNTYGMACTYTSGTTTTSISYTCYDADYQLAQLGNGHPATGQMVVPDGVCYVRLSYTKTYAEHAYMGLIETPGESKTLCAQLDISLAMGAGGSTGGSYTVKAYRNDKRISADTGSFEGSFSDVLKMDIQKSSAYAPDTYRFELWTTVYGYDILLDSCEFTSERRIYTIADEWDLYRVAADPSGYYLAVNDVKLSEVILSVEYGQRFSGTLDFNGHTLTVKPNSGVFASLAANGTLCNLVLEVDGTLSNSVSRPLLCTSVYGTITDVIVRLQGSQPAEYFADGSVKAYANCRLFYYTYGVATVRNISVDLGGDVYCNHALFGYQFAPEIAENIIISGGAVHTFTTSANILSVAGAPRQASSIFIFCDLYCENTATNAATYVSLYCYVAGAARFSNIFGAGDIYILQEDGSYALRTAYGPFTNINSAAPPRQQAYFYSTYSYPACVNAQQVTKFALNNADWYKSIWGDALDITPVSAGYYPQLKLSACMPAQKYIPLPALVPSDQTTLEGAVITEQTDDYALAKFTFSNRGGYDVTAIALEYLDARILLQENKSDGTTTVTARLTPAGTNMRYQSGYDVLSFTRSTEVASSTVTTEFASGAWSVGAEFYKPVGSASEWAAINNDVTQNYRLTRDLDLSVLQPQETILYRNSNTFSGKLDGRGHTVTGMDLKSQYSEVFYIVKGEIKDIIFDGVLNIRTGNTYSSLVHQSSGILSGVSVRNSAFSATYRAAPLIIGNTGTVTGCSSINNSVTATYSSSFSTPYLSGMVCYNEGEGGLITNSFAANVEIDNGGAQSSVIGGFCAYLGSALVNRCYATGVIIDDNSGAGGFVGQIDHIYARISECWSTVDIKTTSNSAGALIGSTGLKLDQYALSGLLALGDISSSVGDTTYLSRLCASDKVSSVNAYGTVMQRINAQTSDELMGCRALLTYKQLCAKETYLVDMGWIEGGWDFSGCAGGLLPKLYGEDGVLLDGQPDASIGGNSELQVTDISTTVSQGTYIVQLEISHGENIVVDSVNFDYLNATLTAATRESTRTTLQYTVTMNRMLDAYFAVSASCTVGGAAKSIELNERIDFGEIFYNDIASAAQWQTVMAAKGKNYENFRITGTIDFSTLPADSAIVRGVRVNRLVGLGEQIICNASLGKTGAASDDTGLINNVTSQLSNLRFENIRILYDSGSTVPYAGVIGAASGALSHLTFSGCEVNSIVSQTGCIGSINYAVANDIKVESCNIISVTTSKRDYGGFAGYAKSLAIYDVTVRQTGVSSKGPYAGGLIGTSVSLTLGTVLIDRCTISAATSASGIIGFAGNTCFAYGSDAALTVRDSDITATSGIAGGMQGDGYATAAFASIEVTGCTVTATSGASGASFGICNAANIHVANCTILATGGYAITLGGGASNTTSYSENNLVIGYTYASGGTAGAAYNVVSRNNKVFGSYNVGGVCASGYGSYLYSLDNYISTIHDSSFKTITGRDVVPVTDNTQQNYNIGGVMGYMGASCYYMVSENNTIKAEGAKNVGGVFGSNQDTVSTTYPIRANASINNTISGGSAVGGIIGSLRNGFVSYCYSNSTVSASEGSAGGIVGYEYCRLPEDTTAVQNRYVSGCYVTGSITAAGGDAGGITGARNFVANDGRYTSNIVAASVSGTGEVHATANTGKPELYTKVWDYTTINGATLDETELPDGCSFVTSEQLQEKTLYTNRFNNGGLNWDSTFWNFSGLDWGYMPYVAVNGAVLPYQEGKNASGVYYSNTDTDCDGGVEIPQPPVSSYALSAAAFTMRSGLPQPVFYASGADKLNIEFDFANPAVSFTVCEGGVPLFTQSVDRRVFTLSCDFSSELTVTVGAGQEYTVDTSALVRTLGVFGEDWYILTVGGLQSGSRLLSDDFVNLYGGEALCADGRVRSAADGSVLRTFTGIGLCDTAPLWTGSYEGYDIETYGTFSVSDGTTVDGVQLFVNDGVLFALDVSDGHVTDALVADSALGKNYLTVLLDSGRLINLQNELCLPEDFESDWGNAGIAEISQNVGQDAPYLLIRYDDGAVCGFDYLTGEYLDFTLPANDVSLFAFARSMFADSRMLSVYDGYTEMVELSERLLIDPPQALAQGAEPDTETGAATSDTGEAADGAMSGGGQDSGEAVGDIADGAAENTQNSAGGANAQKNDAPRGYVPIYNAETGEYALYEAAALLTCEQPVSVQEKLSGTPDAAKYAVSETKRTADTKFDFTSGIGIFLTAAAAVVLLLTILVLLRRGRTARSKTKGRTR